MTIEFEFVEDFRKYREYVSYIAKVEDAKDRMPFLFYQNNGSDVYVIERKGNVLTITLTQNTKYLISNFQKFAQPDSFESMDEGVAFLYDLQSHDLIYDFDSREQTATWNWSTYPGTFWTGEENKYDHGIAIDANGKVCRFYLSNEKFVTMLIAIADLNNLIPNVWGDDQTSLNLELAGTELVLSILADQMGKDEPRHNDVKSAIACDMIDPRFDPKGKRDVQDLMSLFDLGAFEDEYDWDAQWGARLATSIELDNLRDQMLRDTKEVYVPSLESYTDISSNQLCITEIMDLDETPKVDRPTYVHQDVPINGVHYMIINPNQRFCVWHDDLIIKREDFREALSNIPFDQFEFYSDYDSMDDGTSADVYQGD